MSKVNERRHVPQAQEAAEGERPAPHGKEGRTGNAEIGSDRPEPAKSQEPMEPITIPKNGGGRLRKSS
jgi:hypothetical protein